MSYESRIYVVNAKRYEVKGKPYAFAEQLAVIDCSKMDNNFTNLFTDETDYEIYDRDMEGRTKTDCYGNTIKRGEINKIISYIENMTATNPYRRAKVLLATLKAFNKETWDCLEIVHFGC